MGDLYTYLNTASYNYFAHINSSNPMSNPFDNLYDLLLNKKLLTRSYRLCKNNAAPGYDGMTKKDVEENVDGFIDEIFTELKSKNYSPSPLLKSRKPKRNGNGYRNLYIPVLKDKVVQRAFVQILNPINEAIFHNCNYAFRPNRNITDVIRTLKNDLLENELHYVIKTDIEKCFQNLDKKLVLENLDFIKDEVFMGYIRKFLDIKVVDKANNYLMNSSGVPEGTVIGPLLSNVALHSLDTLWMLNHQKAGDLELLRYADDLLFYMKYPDRNFIYEIDKMLGQINLNRNVKKTKSINLRSGKPLRLLGYYIQVKRVKPLNLYIAPKKERISSLMNNLSKIIKSGENSEDEIITKINSNYSSFIKFYRESTDFEWLEDLKSNIEILLKYKGVMPDPILQKLRNQEKIMLY